jgi:outer membrane lipoprotein-sorting protein
MKKRIHAIIYISLCCLVLALAGANADEFLTPKEYLDKVSQKFGSINDLETTVTITDSQTEEDMKGVLIYKSPNKIRLDFSKPAQQVLCSDGQELLVYIPMYSYVLEQRLKRRSQDTLIAMAQGQGLQALKDRYSVAYVVGPQAVALDDNSPEKVIKLKFFSSSASYRQLEIAFTEKEGLIRRITGTTSNKNVILDLTNIRINKNIPDNRFKYSAPANANVYKDFLFEVIE